MKCSEVLGNRMSSIIRRYMDHMKFATYMAFSFIKSFYILLGPFFYCMYGLCSVGFCLILYNMYFSCYVYIYSSCCLYILIFMLLFSYCYICSVLYIVFRCVVPSIVCV